MDEQFQTYLNKQLDELMSSSHFATLNEEQKNQKRAELEDYFYDLILDTLVDNLNDDQLDQLNNADLTAESSTQLISELASQSPTFIFQAQDKIDKALEHLNQTGTVPSPQTEAQA